MLVGLARRLSMKTVAEGIETKEQIDALRAAGVDCFQGYFISRPLPAFAVLTFHNSRLTSHSAQATQPQQTCNRLSEFAIVCR